MKILIPTAKEMRSNSKRYDSMYLSEKTKKILAEILKYDIEELSKIFKLKEDQAEKEFNRFKNIADGTAATYEALYLFDGLMYRNILRDNFTADQVRYLKSNVFITSSFYGIINVCDKISEHRLDFLQNIKIENSSLKNFWRADYTDFVKDEIVISLLSSEFEEVFEKDVRDSFYKVVFMEEQNGELKVHSTISKKARGKFLTEMIKNNVKTIKEIKQIKFDSFVYQDHLSTDRKLIFVGRRGE